MGLGKIIVRQDQGVEMIAWGKARLLGEVCRTGGGGQVPALRHREEIRLPVVQHPPGLGGPDGGGHHIEHVQVVPTGNVAAQGHLHALIQHGPHRRHAGADVLVGVGAMDRCHAGVPHGLPLPRIGPDAVGHDGAAGPQAVFGIGLPVLLAARVDKIIEGPCGTVVYNAETGEYLCDVTEDGQEVILLRGGRGGQGNWHFKTATRQAPRFAQPGEPMQEMTVIMELKLLADVGLVGFPNAGKSTLLSAISAAKPKIADYPFTTLEPNLGIVSYRDGKSFVMADIPGIIEGASQGKGLGLRFLRHIERNSLLLFMVPADSDDIRKEYEILLNELSTFNPEMLDKQRVLAITKSDMLDQELMDEIEPTLPAGVPHVFISSVSGLGISVLKDILWEELNKESNKIEDIVHRPKDVTRLQQELKDMGEDEDIIYEYEEEADDDDEDIDYEYEEEDWEEK